mgnify:CR=1 FL=1
MDQSDSICKNTLICKYACDTCLHIKVFRVSLIMEIEFKHQTYDRLEIEAKYTADFPIEVVRAYRKRMAFIRAAIDEREFYAMKSLHFEKLKGDRNDQYSMKLNKQWRLILEFKKTQNNKNIVVVSIEDYH